MSRGRRAVYRAVIPDIKEKGRRRAERNEGWKEGSSRNEWKWQKDEWIRGLVTYESRQLVVK